MIIRFHVIEYQSFTYNSTVMVYEPYTIPIHVI